MTDAKTLAKVMNGELTLTEFAMSHTCQEVEQLRKQLEMYEHIGEKPLVTNVLSSKLVEQAMSADLKSNPRALLDLAEKHEKAEAKNE